ncbi:DUF4870 domain-containing protein [Leucobacter sp. USHLN153]|uniref:DUF4870 domain-containing protein n=1 Tax=Leucobacter sp. USHLN153 TaxID=3081268 RepID=UPI003015F8AC
MTTLPPEGQGDPSTAGAPSSDPAGTPSAPTTPPAAPEPPQTPPAPLSEPQYAPPQQPQYAPPPVTPPTTPPQASGYAQPPQQPGGYTQPGGYPQPGAGDAHGGYQGPPPGGYQQQGYAQPVTDPATNVTLNYWLSVFFTWIPALIFYLVDKDKGDQRLYAYQRDNLNFSLLRLGVGLATWILGVIPYIGWLFAFLLGIGSIVLFVFHIIAAVKSTESFRRGEHPGFIFNVPLVK